MSWFRNLVHTFKLEIFIVDSAFDRLYLSACHFANTFTKLFESTNKRGRVGNHSSYTVPSFFFIFSASGFEDHDCDTKSSHLRWWLVERFESSELLAIDHVECLFSSSHLRLSILQNLISNCFLLLDLCHLNIQLFFLGYSCSLIFLYIDLNHFYLSKQCFDFLCFSINFFLFDL